MSDDVPSRLRVAVRATTDERRAALEDRVEARGHTVVESGADLVLVDAGADAATIDAAIASASNGLLARNADPATGAAGFAPVPEALPLLTPRESEILAALGEGMSNKELARALGISAHTVKFHLETIFRKLEVTSRAEAVAKGLRRGIIEL